MPNLAALILAVTAVDLAFVLAVCPRIALASPCVAAVSEGVPGRARSKQRALCVAAEARAGAGTPEIAQA
eukprot:6184110-Pleurochrysis_carterae.AAC.2